MMRAQLKTRNDRTNKKKKRKKHHGVSINFFLHRASKSFPNYMNKTLTSFRLIIILKCQISILASPGVVDYRISLSLSPCGGFCFIS